MELMIFLLLVLLVDQAALKWGPTAEKAEIVLNGNDAETFLSKEQPMTSQDVFEILLASLNRLFAMKRFT